MSNSMVLGDFLSFDAHVPKLMNPQWWEAIFTTYINWLYTNKQGMIFGLSFAILLMTILTLIKPLMSKSSGGFYSSLSGLFMGAPLGVCVNCAAPIAYGLYTKGTRIETALSLMISSPTLNIIVVTMAFALFPFYMVVIKLVLVLIIILFIIPLLAKLFPEEVEVDEIIKNNNVCDVSDETLTYVQEKKWKSSIIWLMKEIAINTWQIALKVVPLMLLAGFLGAVVINLLPWDMIVTYTSSLGVKWTVLMIFLIALFGLFLPVPIAFDIIIVLVLMNSGLPIKYAATLLFVLGSFSIYSYMVVYKAGAKKTANALVIVLILLGFLQVF